MDGFIKDYFSEARNFTEQNYSAFTPLRSREYLSTMKPPLHGHHLKRLSSTLVHGHSTGYTTQLTNARNDCAAGLRNLDKSSYALSAYIPEPARDTFLAIRCFQLEMAKIQKDSSSGATKKSPALEGFGLSASDLKLKFWQDLLKNSVFDEGSDKVINEPIALLLRESVRQGYNLEKSYFDQIIATRRDFLKRGYFETIDEMSSFGEGYYSQFNYLVQNLLLSEQLSPSSIRLVEESEVIRDLMVEILAHIGQATGIASIVIASKYYATSKNEIYLPVQVMNQFELSQEDTFRLFQGHLKDDRELVKSKLKDVVYETCVVANDHLLTARRKYQSLQEEINRVVKSSNDKLLLDRVQRWKKSIPDCIYVPFMSSIPLVGYLNQLEANDFDIVDRNIENPYWRLVWSSYTSYRTRQI